MIPLFKVHMPQTAISRLEKTLSSGFIAEGPAVSEFTKLASDYINNPYCVMVNSCTMALTIAYRLANVGPGDEVITTPLTCVASNEPIVQLGAIPIWADCDLSTGMIDPESVRSLITEKTKAILVLHKEGDPARISEINAIAKEHGIKVIEDSAHSFGTKINGTFVGNTSDISCFSFQAIKHISTGDGGMIALKTEEDYLRAKRLKWFGIDRDARKPGENAWLNDVPESGYKGNMNDIAASIGIEQMKHLDDILQKHNRHGRHFSKVLKDVPGVELIARNEDDFSTYWAYCFKADNRDALQKKLESQGIASGQIHIRNDIYSMFGNNKRDLPGVDNFSEKEICIPCGWWLSDEDLDKISSVIQEGW